ncbi:MAG: signal peptidase II [Clostridia bacterium]|nr:signal peptidase II [Clostridia bacterium]
MIYCLLISLGVVVLDQITKVIVMNAIPAGKVIEVIKGVLNLTYVENKGAAFGMLSEHRWVFMVISVVAIVAIFVFIKIEKPKSYWVKTPLAFILGGGIGNMIDRVFRPGVVDFIDAAFVQYPSVSFDGGFSVSLEDFPIFNIADCFITVGCGILIVYLLAVELPREAKAEKEKKISANAENNDSNSANAEKESESKENEQ